MADSKEELKRQKEIEESKKRQNSLTEDGLNLSSKSIVNAEQLKKELSAINDEIQSITDYSAAYSKYIKDSVTGNLNLKRILQDKAKILTDEIISKNKIKRLLDETYELEKNSADLTKIRKQYDSELESIGAKNLSQKQQKKLIDANEKEMLDKVNSLLGTSYTKIKDVLDIDIKRQKVINQNKQFIEDINKKLMYQESLETVLLSLFGENVDKVKNMGSALLKVNDIFKGGATGGIITVLLLLKDAFVLIKDVLMEQNKQVTELQRNLMVSADEARKMREEFVSMERTSSGVGSAFETVKNMIEASVELASAFNASINFAGKSAYELVKNQIALTKELGLSGEEAGKLQTTMLMLNMNEQKYGEMVAKSTLEGNARTGVTFNLKNIMAEIAKTSSAITLSLMRNPKALADAVVKAKELGTTIEKMSNIADALLDIEQSIGAQYEASVLTGRLLNFELAREKALRNDIAGATADILQQIGTASDFTNMNRVQQEAIAKAVGMTRDELASSLITQENYNKLSEKARKDLLTGRTEEERKAILAAAMDEKSAYAAAKKVDAQSKINQMQEKFYSILGNVFTALEPIVDAFASILEILGPIFGIITRILTPISAMAEFFGKSREDLGLWVKLLDTILGAFIAIQAYSKANAMWTGINNTLLGIAGVAESKITKEKEIQAASSGVIAALTGNWAGIAAAIIAGGAIVGGIYSATRSRQDDAMIGPDGGLVVSGAKGTYQLNKNDTVIAGTALGAPKAESKNTNSAQLDVVIQKLNQVVDAINKKSFDVYLDGKQVSKNLAFASSQKNK